MHFEPSNQLRLLVMRIGPNRHTFLSWRKRMFQIFLSELHFFPRCFVAKHWSKLPLRTTRIEHISWKTHISLLTIPASLLSWLLIYISLLRKSEVNARYLDCWNIEGIILLRRHSLHSLVRYLLVLLKRAFSAINGSACSFELLLHIFR